MRDQGKGVLVNVSSIAGAVPQPYTQAYIMAKHAIRGLSGCQRQELLLGGPRGIRVCTVLFREVLAAGGEQHRDLFEELVRPLAVHETAEEEVVHPADPEPDRWADRT